MRIIKGNDSLSFAERIEEFVSTEKNKIKFVLLGLIILLILLSLGEYFNLKHKLQQANKYETILVLVAKKKIELGAKLNHKLLEFIPYSLKKVNDIEAKFGEIVITESNFSEFKNKLENSIVNKDILEGDLIRKDLFTKNFEPVIANLIPENHSVIDLEIDHKGSKKFFKAGDKVKLYQKSKKRLSKKFSKQGQIVLLKKPSTENQKLEISLAVPNSIFKEVLSAHSAKELELIIEKDSKETISNKSFKQSDFQKLIFNNSKEIKVY